MVSKVIFWTGFGLLSRFWQLGIQQIPFFNYPNVPVSMFMYGVYGSIGASFGHWLQGVEQRQQIALEERKASLLEKRARYRAKQAAAQQAAQSPSVEDTIKA